MHYSESNQNAYNKAKKCPVLLVNHQLLQKTYDYHTNSNSALQTVINKLSIYLHIFCALEHVSH